LAGLLLLEQYIIKKVLVTRPSRVLLVSCDLPDNKGPRHGQMAGIPLRSDRKLRNVMLTAKKPKIQVPPTTADYQPDELEAMRQAFIRACRENPDVAATDSQRYDLADALVSVYRKDLTQSELVVSAVSKVKKIKT
jgi:hypothetical protein